MSILTTKHGAERLQQRGIRPYQIEFLVDYGTGIHANGCIKYIFDKEAVRRFEKDKGRDVLISQIVRELKNAFALTSNDGELVTAGWLTKSVRTKWGSFGKTSRHEVARWRKRH
jgi:hypothetical protein